MPVLLATPRCLNPENCVVVCPAECFDFSFYTRVVVSGHPLSSGYLAYLKGVSNECYALGDCSCERLAASDDMLRHIYKEIVNLASRTTKMGSPHKMYVALCQRYKVSETEFNVALMIFDQVGLVTINDKGFVSISKKNVKLTDSVTYRNLKHE